MKKIGTLATAGDNLTQLPSGKHLRSAGNSIQNRCTGRRIINSYQPCKRVLSGNKSAQLADYLSNHPLLSTHPLAHTPVAILDCSYPYLGLGGSDMSHGGLGVAEDANREVLDVSGPLGSQLEKLDIIPLHAVNGHYGERERERERRKRRKTVHFNHLVAILHLLKTQRLN